jgi:hypothetical protein
MSSASFNFGLPVSKPGFVTRIAPRLSRKKSRKLSNLRSKDASSSFAALRALESPGSLVTSKSSARGSGLNPWIGWDVLTSLLT